VPIQICMLFHMQTCDWVTQNLPPVGISRVKVVSMFITEDIDDLMKNKPVSHRYYLKYYKCNKN